jgi:hypothetical protein
MTKQVMRGSSHVLGPTKSDPSTRMTGEDIMPRTRGSTSVVRR